MMRLEELDGKGVVDSEARLIGHVTGLEFDTANWKITHICVKLADSAVEDFGYKKPRFGSINILIPVEVVKAVKDIIALTQGFKDLQSVVLRRE